MSTKYKNTDIVITVLNEVMFYDEAFRYGNKIRRAATEHEKREFQKEVEYWKKQNQEQSNESNYHEINE